jgi:hypothetical protein
MPRPRLALYLIHRIAPSSGIRHPPICEGAPHEFGMGWLSSPAAVRKASDGGSDPTSLAWVMPAAGRWTCHESGQKRSVRLTQAFHRTVPANMAPMRTRGFGAGGEASVLNSWVFCRVGYLIATRLSHHTI